MGSRKRINKNHFFDHPKLPVLNFLDPHQIDGVAWILSRSRSYLAHAPGAGKTAQAIVASRLASSNFVRTLFIVPPTLTLNWKREINKFCDYLEYFPSTSILPQTPKRYSMDWDADYIIVPDSMLAKDWVLKELGSRLWRLIAVDEASRMKNAETKRAKSFYDFLLHLSPYVVFLDGSPMPNRPMELWAPSYYLSPQSIDFMGMYDFGFRYCGAQINDFGKWEFKGSSNELELHNKLTKDFMHVVKESELKHPERLRTMLFMPDDVRTSVHKAWDRINLSTLKLKDLDESASQGDLARFRRELGLRKVPWIAEYVADRLKNKNESILLFVWHREVALELKELLRQFNPGVVMGGTVNADREMYFKLFQEGRCRLIIGNISAMGRGHNLQKADRVIFGEFSWTDELNKQCEKRASRRGRDTAAFVRCEYVIAPGSMDEPILNAIFTKAKRVERIIG